MSHPQTQPGTVTWRNIFLERPNTDSNLLLNLASELMLNLTDHFLSRLVDMHQNNKTKSHVVPETLKSQRFVTQTLL